MYLLNYCVAVIRGTHITHRAREEFMKCHFETGSGAIIYILKFHED
jgi:hypothetical protein